MGVGEAKSPSLTDLTIPDGEGEASSEVRRTERVGKKDHCLFSRKVTLGFRRGKTEDGRNRGETCPRDPSPKSGSRWGGRRSSCSRRGTEWLALGAGLRPSRDEALLQLGQKLSAAWGTVRGWRCLGPHVCVSVSHSRPASAPSRLPSP